MPTQNSFRLPVEVAERFDRYVQENSINVSKLLLKLIEAHLRNAEVKSA